MSERLRDWVPDAVVALAVLVVGLLELTSLPPWLVEGRGEALTVVLAFAVACGLSRQAPLAALALVWVTCAAQLVAGTPVLGVQAAVALVAFGCARWGARSTVVVSGLSILAAGAGAYALTVQVQNGVLIPDLRPSVLVGEALLVGDSLAEAALLLGLLLLAVPWLVGLALRATALARRSEIGRERAEADAARAQHETEQAHEIARLREQQATLARDVHDVVGHSLAVILAQAESGQFLPDDDPAALKRTMATIATSARSSLQDVRSVLTPGADPAPPARGSFEELVDGVRAAGHDVRTSEVGAARPLPPELEVVAHRVAQEMLTNAIRHGRRDRPVHVERHWPEGAWDRDLRIEVRNVAERSGAERSGAGHDDETQPVRVGPTTGQGLDGMRRRLDAVGGRLDVRRREEGGEPTFTATAWVPVSGR